MEFSFKSSILKYSLNGEILEVQILGYMNSITDYGEYYIELIQLHQIAEDHIIFMGK